MARNPVVDGLPSVPVRFKSQNLSENHGTAAFVRWIADHSVWKSDLDSHSDPDAVEPRTMPTHVLRVRLEKSGDDPELKWEQKWEDDDIPNTNMKEIYGVIRVEYYFLKQKSDAPWHKLACKFGAQGIDSLFRRNAKFAICESKASVHYDKYLKYIAVGPGGHGRKDVFDVLGTIKDPVDPQRTVLQMSWRWVLIKIDGMIAGGDMRRVRKRDPSLQAAADRDYAARRAIARNARDLRDMMSGEIERWFNYYGTDPFYRLPGKYKLVAARSAEFVVPDADLPTTEKEFDWPGEDRARPEEFIRLDEYEPFLSQSGETRLDDDDVPLYI